MKNIKYILIGIFLVIIDQIIKYFMLGKNITIISNLLSIDYRENRGGAFSIGSFNIILIFSIILIIAILLYLIKNKDNITNFIPLIFILSGSISNLIDRLFRGYVIDYINVNIFNFPIFNIADILIVIGCFLFIIQLFFKSFKLNEYKNN